MDWDALGRFVNSTPGYLGMGFALLLVFLARSKWTFVLSRKKTDDDE